MRFWAKLQVNAIRADGKPEEGIAFFRLQMGNQIQNNPGGHAPDNPALPNVHAFERWKFVEYQPVQGRINILHPTGLTDHYDFIQVKQL